MEFRCAERLHLILVDGVIEVKCKSKRCGAGRGNVVLHRFNAKTGQLVETRKYKDPRVMFDQARVLQHEPNNTSEEVTHVNAANRAAVRSA